jgi:transcriptional regulator with XRE-family HTH domain
MENLTKKLAKVIREKRIAAGLSQEELAEKADIDRTYVSIIERGRVNITLAVALKIARSLNLSLSKIIKEVEK